MSNEEQKEEPRFAIFERHISTLIGAVLLGLLVWNWNTTQNMSVRFAVMENSIQNLTFQITKLSEATKDRYTSGQAVRDHAVIQRDIDRLELRINAVEKELSVRP